VKETVKRLVAAVVAIAAVVLGVVIVVWRYRIYSSHFQWNVGFCEEAGRFVDMPSCENLSAWNDVWLPTLLAGISVIVCVGIILLGCLSLFARTSRARRG
jgi:hypothetical protein